MSSVVDVWRAIDPEATLVSGDPGGLRRSVRGVLRSRAAPPHLPPRADGELLVLDAALLGSEPLDALLGHIAAAELRPSALLLGASPAGRLDRAGDELPVLASARSPASLTDAAAAYLGDESGHLTRLVAALRLSAAEAALADPQPAAPAGLVAGRIRRGVAVGAGGELRALNPRPAGRALAARFAAVHARLLANASARSEPLQRNVDGLWLLEHRVHAEASIWLFDDLPFARVDAAAAEALGITLRALLRRPATVPAESRTGARQGRPAAEPRPDADLDATLLAVARANGRVAPAARELGVHRNTVLYRLRRARAERGIDPRRPADALRLLRDAERPQAGSSSTS